MTDWEKFDELKRKREVAIARARLASVGDDEPDSKVTVVIQQQAATPQPKAELANGDVELEKTAAGAYKLRGKASAVVAIVLLATIAFAIWRLAPGH